MYRFEGGNARSWGEDVGQFWEGMGEEGSGAKGRRCVWSYYRNYSVNVVALALGLDE